ncbi:MAG: hypothetical protein J3K34DRAFT_522675 [Monoraphidium minutum]|nr:MAG: hypothetical protein J3K34DRAFT_522675 [Monoraphidium minutum]
MKRQRLQAPSGAEVPRCASSLCDLDDALLSKVLLCLDPFPGVANAALTCRRFLRLATDKGRWLVVAPHVVDAAGTPSGRAGPRFRSLAAAVAASRPGDTIWLAPHVRHEAAAVRLRWPLHICGGGAGATLLASPSGEAALDVCASAKIIGVTIESRLGPCIMHRRAGARGTLVVESCALTCYNGGLDHLVAPIITAAASPAEPRAAPPPAAGGAAAGGAQRPRRAPAAQPAAAGAAGGDAPAAGRLAVADTRLEGTSGCGVLCAGTGAVRGVRVVRGSCAAWVYLEVDSRDPGVLPPGARSALAALGAAPPPAPPPAAAAARGGPAAAKAAAAWRGGAAPGGARLRPPMGVAAGSSGSGPAPSTPVRACPEAAAAAAAASLSRINALLGAKAISPALLADHLSAQAAAQAHTRP